MNHKVRPLVKFMVRWKSHGINIRCIIFSSSKKNWREGDKSRNIMGIVNTIVGKEASLVMTRVDRLNECGPTRRLR